MPYATSTTALMLATPPPDRATLMPVGNRMESSMSPWTAWTCTCTCAAAAAEGVAEGGAAEEVVACAAVVGGAAVGGACVVDDVGATATATVSGADTIIHNNNSRTLTAEKRLFIE